MKFVVTAVVFAAVLVGVITLADLDRLGPLHVVYEFRYGDKAGHFFMLGTMAFLVDLALLELLRRANPYLLVLLAGLTVATLTSMEEVSQFWMPKRSPDVFDVMASYAGIMTASVIVLLIKRPARDVRSLPGPEPAS
jgi:VanZ family protein